MLEADLALTKQKQVLELGQLEEAGRRKVTEAKLQCEEDEEKVPETSGYVPERQRVRDWIEGRH